VIPVKGRGPNPAQEHEGPQPYFDIDFQRNVTAISTQTAFLHCRVKDLGLKAVSHSMDLWSKLHLFFFVLRNICRRFL
jgi:hypothetical protein